MVAKMQKLCAGLRVAIWEDDTSATGKPQLPIPVTQYVQDQVQQVQDPTVGHMTGESDAR